MKPLDWKELGRFFSLCLNLFSIIRDTFAKMKVGIEIVEWLVGEGKEAFVEKCLKPLGAEYLATQRLKVINVIDQTTRVKVIDQKTIMVNLDVPLALPFVEAKIEFRRGGSGWVKVEKRPDGELYVDGRKVTPYLSECQKGMKMIRGHELRDELSEKTVLHPNIMDALIEHPCLIPKDWMEDGRGSAYFVFFWGVIFRGAGGALYVRCFYFDGHGWRREFYWLNNDFDFRRPAALLED